MGGNPETCFIVTRLFFFREKQKLYFWSCSILIVMVVLGLYSQHSPAAQDIVSNSLAIYHTPGHNPPMSDLNPDHIPQIIDHTSERIPLVKGHIPERTSVVIRSLAIDEDSFLRQYRTNISQNGTLPMSFRQLKLNIRTTYRVSLTKEEQVALANSTAAKKIQQVRAENTCKPENLLAMGPIKFLPDYKSPCWYSADQRLRCLPYFFLIGAPKSGTSDIFNMLRLHPDFQYLWKEYHWLTRDRFCRPTPEKIKGDSSIISSFNWYTGLIGKPLFFRKPPNHPRQAVTGDASVSTIWQNDQWPIVEENSLTLEPMYTNPDYIYHLNNRTKIMAILRNPIDRLLSDYIYFNPTPYKGPRDFHQSVIKSINYFTNCMKTYSVRSCVYSASPKATADVPVRLHVGLYFIYLLDWFRVFPRDQLLILRLEDYTYHRAQSAIKIYDFLDLRNVATQALIRSSYFEEATNRSYIANSIGLPGSKIPTMLEETRYLLYTFYKPFNQALGQLMNDSGFDYGPY